MKNKILVLASVILATVGFSSAAFAAESGILRLSEANVVSAVLVTLSILTMLASAIFDQKTKIKF